MNLCAAVVGLAAAAGAVATYADDTRRSGLDYVAPATQALQRDDSQNPAMLWVRDGEELWSQRATADTRSCADCHGPAREAMRGVAARYPAWDSRASRAVDLGERIQLCRERHQAAPRWPAESRELLALQSLIALQSRGLPMAQPADARLDATRARGEERYRARIGQLDLACADCHDTRAGQRLGGSVIPQAHAVGYPTYRLEWQGLGSLQRRLRNCLGGVRAEPFPYAADELIELELYLAARDRGMALEAPAVRP